MSNPSWLGAPTLTPPQRQVYDILLEAWKRRDPLPSVRSIAVRTGMNQTRAHGILQELAELGVVSRAHRGAYGLRLLVTPPLCRHCEGTGVEG